MTPEEKARCVIDNNLRQSGRYAKSSFEYLLPLDVKGFRKCQINTINNLEKSFADNRPKALVQMATGAGKTFTAITASYRLLKYGNMKRILFLVDTKGLGEQAEREFLAYTPNDDPRSFSHQVLSEYAVLKSSYIPNEEAIVDDRCRSCRFCKMLYPDFRKKDLFYQSDRMEEIPLQGTNAKIIWKIGILTGIIS